MVQALALLVFVAALRTGYGLEKHCLLYRDRCVSHCPLNMHAYHTRCDEDAQSQRTCDEPFIYSLGYTCGWSRCDCNGDLLLEEKTDACVNYLTCTMNYGGQTRRRPRKHRKLVIPEDEDEFPSKK